MPDEKRHPYPVLCASRNYLQFFRPGEQFGTLLAIYTVKGIKSVCREPVTPGSPHIRIYKSMKTSQKYEYTVVMAKKSISGMGVESTLNTYAKNGWVLDHVIEHGIPVTNPDYIQLILRREI